MSDGGPCLGSRVIVPLCGVLLLLGVFGYGVDKAALLRLGIVICVIVIGSLFDNCRFV